MKLKELLDSIESTKGKTLPTAKALRNGSSPLVASKEFEDGFFFYTLQMRAFQVG